MSSQIKMIMKDDWYKSATNEEMRIALMHLEMNVMDTLTNDLNDSYKVSRQAAFDRAMKDIGAES